MFALHLATPEMMKTLPPLNASNFGSVESISRELLTNYVWGFELAGGILLLAVVGVGLLAYRKPRNKGLVKKNPNPEELKAA
jgi:NADH:ubiquinone oxidoreductase subunit 6 (subunit J)